jgi:hypothetical protein
MQNNDMLSASQSLGEFENINCFNPQVRTWASRQSAEWFVGHSGWQLWTTNGSLESVEDEGPFGFSQFCPIPDRMHFPDADTIPVQMAVCTVHLRVHETFEPDNSVLKPSTVDRTQSKPERALRGI